MKRIDKPRLVVTGARGFVAGHVIHEAFLLGENQAAGRWATSWEVHAASRGDMPVPMPGIVWHRADVAIERTARFFIGKVQPDAVIHCSALADIDYCKAHPDESHLANVEATRNVALACVDTGARLIHVSTDNVFDGERGPYRETDAADPVNLYGRQKLEAEQLARAIAANHVIARTALVIGMPATTGGNSFLTRMLPKLAAGEPLGVPAEEIRSPIDVVTLARALLELAQANYTGIVHLAGNDILSRLDMAQRIAAHFGHDPNLVHANNPTSIPGRDERPRDCSLDNTLARSMLLTPMLGLEAALGLCSGVNS